MAQPYLSEIRIFSFNYAPRGWAFCNGQSMIISQNTALFSLLGTFYGGDGRSTFSLPNLQGRVPVHQGSSAAGNYTIGQMGGEVNHTLAINEMPAHSHTVGVGGTATSTNAQSNCFGVPTPSHPAAQPVSPDLYSATGGATANASMIGATGAGAPHENMQPYLTLNFCIALTGVYPSRN